MNWRLIAKTGFLLVIMGFFMPVACNQNAFQVAELMMSFENTFSGILIYLIFFSAIAGVCVGVLLLKEKKVDIKVDWGVVGIAVVSFLFLLIRHLDGSEEVRLQTGFYIILLGLLFSLVGQFLGRKKKA